MSPTLTFTGNGLTLTGTGFTFGIPIPVTVAAAGGGGGGGGAGNPEDMTITISSTTFNNGDDLTSGGTYKFGGGSCGGTNTSPQLSWTVSGSNTDVAEFRMTCIDLDGNNFIHWNISGIDPSSGSIDENGSWAEGVTVGNTGWAASPFSASVRANGWGGPCPPSGTHTYQFQITAHDSYGDAVSQGGSALVSNTISFEHS